MKTKMFGVMFMGALLGTVACGVEVDGAGEEGAAIETGATSDELSYAAHGFAWVNTASGPVNSLYSYNTAGGAITVASGGTGMYTVTFAGLGGSGGNVQAVAYGTSNIRCKVLSWGGAAGSALNINVRCHTPSGALADSAFVVQYGRRTTGFNGAGAYLWADQPLASSYSPSATYSWNSTGGTNTIARSGVGVYSASLPGLAATAGSVQVTAYGGGGEHCKVSGWGPWGSAQSVTVRCYGAGGSPADTLFSLNYFGHQNVSMYDYGAYAWADDPTSAAYTPSASYSYNSGEIAGWPGCVGWIGSNSAGRLSTGKYFMRHTLLDELSSSVHVTAYGSDSSYCKVEGWFASGDGVEVRSACYSSSGAVSDTRYVETYTSKWFRGPC